MNPKKQTKYMSPYYFLFYIQYEKARNTKWFAKNHQHHVNC